MIAFYKISLDESIIEKATEQHFKFLKFVWAFKQNNIGDIQDDEEKQHVDFIKLFGIIIKTQNKEDLEEQDMTKSTKL